MFVKKIIESDRVEITEIIKEIRKDKKNISLRKLLSFRWSSYRWLMYYNSFPVHHRFIKTPNVPPRPNTTTN